MSDLIMRAIYIQNDKPEQPTNVFEYEKDAIDWLKTFL
jgi:hypothetical protein